MIRFTRGSQHVEHAVRHGFLAGCLTISRQSWLMLGQRLNNNDQPGFFAFGCHGFFLRCDFLRWLLFLRQQCLELIECAPHDRDDPLRAAIQVGVPP